MARFVFPYAAVLRYREQRERQAELRKSMASQQVQVCLAEENALREQMKQTAASLQPRLRQSQSMEAWLMAYRQTNRLEVLVVAAGQRTAEAVKALEAADAHYRKAAQEAEALRQFRERQSAEHGLAATRDEQQRLDEIVMRRWGMKDEEPVG